MNAFQQPLNSYSQPTKSQFGYHIIKVIDYKKNPLLSRYDYKVHRDKIKYLLEYKIGEKLTGQYVEKLTGGADIKVYPDYIKTISQNMEITKNTDIIHSYYDNILKNN